MNTLNKAIIKFGLNCTANTLRILDSTKSTTKLKQSHNEEEKRFSYENWNENHWIKVVFFDSTSIGKRYFNSSWRKRGVRIYKNIPRQFVNYAKAYAAVTLRKI